MNKTQKKILLLSVAVIAVSSLVLSAVFHKPAAPEPVPETETAVPEKKITAAEYYDWSSDKFRENKAVNVSVNDPSLNVDNEGTGYDAAFAGVDFDADDPILTLQTCVLNRADLRLIVVAKEISRMKLTDKMN